MNTKKTINVLRGLALTGCFMITQQAAAQLWDDADYGGTTDDVFIINDNKSDDFSALRLQSYNNNAWNINNDGDLWWGYADNDTNTDRGIEKMRLTTDGNLSVSGTAHFSGNNAPSTSEQGAYIGWNGLTGNTGETDFINHKGLGAGGFAFYNTDGDGSVKTLQMLIDGSGNVGIGTASPGSSLSFGTTVKDRILGLYDDTSAWYGFGISNYTMRLQVGNSSARFAFYAGDATEVMRIQGDGNVGVGTTNPSEKLEVAGVTSSQGLRIPGRYNFGQSQSGIEMEVASGSYNAIRGFDGSEHAGTIHFFDDTWQSGASGKSAGAININGDVATTIGAWDAPVAYFRNSDGNVGIGITSPSQKLDVDGTVKASSFTSSASSFPDYVFAEDYTITPLSELETYVKTNKHLPNMPSEKEVVKNGLNIPEVVTKSVENIEVIYLHLIRMEKKIEALEQENANLKQQLKQGR